MRKSPTKWAGNHVTPPINATDRIIPDGADCDGSGKRDFLSGARCYLCDGTGLIIISSEEEEDDYMYDQEGTL